MNETVQYKCPNCGAALEFKADKNGFGCEYCQSFFTDEEVKRINEDVDLSQNLEQQQTLQDDFNAHTNLYTCSSCGAEIISEDTTAATFCIYCHNPVMLTGRLSGNYRPAKVIPFKKTKEDAHALFDGWCKKKWFLPNSFKTEKQLEKMAGMYVPFWIADCRVDADVHAVGKKIRTWTSGDTRYTETKEYALHRSADVFMNGIPADGASKVDDDIMQAIEPYDYDELKEFSMAYLSGFLADKYDVDKSQVFPKIKNRAVDGCDRLIRATMKSYDTVNVTSSRMNVLKTDWQYIMMPVWFMNYKYKGKTYSFAINGQTGNLAGIPPLSIPKLLRFCGAIALGIGIILTVGGYLFS